MGLFFSVVKPGKQVVTRRSQQSNVTTNPPRGFLKLKKLPTAAPSPSVKEYCGCGWPHNLLIPKGRVEGMRFQLFVMVTDWENDKVMLEQNAMASWSYAFLFLPLW